MNKKDIDFFSLLFGIFVLGVAAIITGGAVIAWFFLLK